MVVTELEFDLNLVKGSLPIHGDGTRSGLWPDMRDVD